MANVVVGIDLGTTYSCVGICRNKKVEIIHNELGNRTTPSYVAFTDDGLRLIGDDAKNQLIRNPKNTIFNIKRLMGRNWDDDVVQNEIKNFPFEVVERNTRPHVKIAREKKGERYFSAEQISAVILRKMVKTAEAFLNEKIKNVVITVPAYFNDAQRQATKNAGSIAGLNVLRILNEPTAAAVAYGLNTLQGNKTILVFDLGGGTLDVSILKIENTTFTVLATCGNTHLGGEDFDQNVVNHFIKLYMQKKRKDVSKDNRAVQKLRREVEKAKKVLTFALSSQIDIDGFFEGEDFSEMLTKAKFENLNKDLFSSTLEPIAQALKDAKLQKNDIDEIVMVGGSSRIPKIRELITEFFDGKQPFVKINPDEAIAYGAAIEAGILSGQQDSVVLNDVNPLSLGIEMSSKMMKIFIPRNTVIPVKKSYNLTTAYDYQTEGLFSIYEGELPVAKDNLLLGEFLLSNITEARRGVPVIKTTFEIDENGLLHVSAEDSVTKERRDICIDYAKNRPTLEEINAMIKISEEYDKLDEKYNDSVISRIEFSERLYWLRNNLDEKNLSMHTKEFLKEFIDDNLKWLEEVKICNVKEYRERQEKFEDILNLIENK